MEIVEALWPENHDAPCGFLRHLATSTGFSRLQKDPGDRHDKTGLLWLNPNSTAA